MKQPDTVSWGTKQWTWRKLLLGCLMGYAVFYLSGTRTLTPQEPHYSFYLGSDYDGGIGWDPVSLWKQMSLAELVLPDKYQPDWRAREISNQKSTGLSAVAGHAPSYSLQLPRTTSDVVEAADRGERLVTHTLTVHLLVSEPIKAAEQIHTLAQSLGGYVTTANTNISGDGEHAANITFRVPASRVEDARTTLRHLAIVVEKERSGAGDITKEFVDRNAVLRNFHAEEQQYLRIMQRASLVRDVLEISGKLSDVRGRIEKIQGEMQYLSQQVEMATITAYIDEESKAKVFGMRWRPLYRLRSTAHDALDALGEYCALMLAFLLHLPAIVLWTVTVFAGAGLAWRLVGRLLQLFLPGLRPHVRTRPSE